LEGALSTNGNRSNRRPICRMSGDALKEGPQVAATEMERCQIWIRAYSRSRKYSVN